MICPDTFTPGFKNIVECIICREHNYFGLNETFIFMHYIHEVKSSFM